MNIIDFQKYITLKHPNATFPSLYLLSTWMFIFGLSLLGSKFIFSPGIDINLPSSQERFFQYTSSSLTIGKNDLLIFNDKIVMFNDLYAEFSEFLSTRKKDTEHTILIRIDSEISLQKFLYIAQIAKQAGFLKVHIATERINN